jgi:starch phosphorylase
MNVKVNSYNLPQWNEVVVQSTMPPGLQELQEIAYNLWWTWHFEAVYLFRDVDPQLWADSGHNPILMLENVSYARLQVLRHDTSFMKRLKSVYDAFRAYIDAPHAQGKPSVAYFSMEYGLTEILKIYSGGLGVLAGDYLKEASDCSIDMTAVGLLYRNGYFNQGLSMDGQQIANYVPQNFDELPLSMVRKENGDPLVLELDFPGYVLYVNVWVAQVGRVPLYLLDTDNALNSEYDRQITAQLYGGDWENRLKQEYLLGIGGMLLLNTLGIKKQIYHCNEGHAALINAQRLVDLVQDEKLRFAQAMEVVRATGLYTVHTPVPAGHDQFEEDLFAKYMSRFPAKLGISWNEFIDLGRENPGTHEKFSMSVFACNACQEVNGVSWLHGKVSQEMFNPIWKGYFPQELHVNYVTNGVHMPTWTASEWQRLYYNCFGGQAWLEDQSNLKHWEKIYEVSDEEVWETRQVLKQKLFEYVLTKYKENWLRNLGDPGRVMSILDKLNPNALTIGFGRRFATYKRAHLLFTDLERLSNIVNNPKYPVQFLFTGKAHPADGGGQGLIKRIVEISRRPEFQGKIIFLENYDMALARRLISGVDIWLNTPTRPLEASGTSGQKAEMNGVLNFSVLDGWWLEGYEKGAGWALTDKITYENPEHQDQLDAATIYSMLENEIIPLYFDKNEKGYSPDWVMHIKKSIARIAPRFTTKRMIDDYLAKFYVPMSKRAAGLVQNGFEKAKEIADWKERVAAYWDDVQVAEWNIPDEVGADMQVGKSYDLAVTLSNVKSGNDLGVELVIRNYRPDGGQDMWAIELERGDCVDGKQSFRTQYTLQRAGRFSYAFRLYPRNPELPHRQDFCYVKWLNR